MHIDYSPFDSHRPASLHFFALDGARISKDRHSSSSSFQHIHSLSRYPIRSSASIHHISTISQQILASISCTSLHYHSDRFVGVRARYCTTLALDVGSSPHSSTSHSRHHTAIEYLFRKSATSLIASLSIFIVSYTDGPLFPRRGESWPGLYIHVDLECCLGMIVFRHNLEWD